MNNQELTQLNQIYNTLLMVSTKGQDTVLMGQCIYAMEQLVNIVNQRLQKEAKEASDESSEEKK